MVVRIFGCTDYITLSDKDFFQGLWENKEDRNLNHVGLRPFTGLNSVWELEAMLDPRQLLKIRYFVWIPFYGLSQCRDALSVSTAPATTT